MRLILIFVTLIAFNSSASQDRADFELSIELGMQEKAREIVKVIDPYAIVVVDAQLKSVSRLQLPGTGVTVIDAFQKSRASTINESRLKSLSVKILSTLDPFPEDVAQLLRETLSIDRNTLELSVERMADSTFAQIKAQVDRQSQLQFENTSSLFLKAMTFLGLLGGLFLFVIFFGGRYIGAFLSQLPGGISVLAEKFEGTKAPSQLFDSTSSTQIQKPHTVHRNSNSDQDFSSNKADLNDLPSESLLALLSDCYWSELDSYAAWLWQHVGPKVRQELLQLWPPLKEYASYFCALEAQMQRYHEDPYYLTPQPIHGVSQQDLQKWIEKKQLKNLNQLSPIRQKHLNIPLEKRLAAFNSKSTTNPVVDLPNSPLRELPCEIDASQMSAEDDLLILNSPHLVPENMRIKLPSTSWLALLPLEKRRELLSTLSAQDISALLLGPEPAIAAIEEAVPERKFALVKDYANQIKPSRSSMLFRRVSALASSMLDNTALEKAQLDEAA